jgi:predicted phage terminase large subunit-like protein
MSAQAKPTTLSDYSTLAHSLLALSPAEQSAVMRHLCLTDLYWLLRYGLLRADAQHPWILARCVEVQESADGHLDLWSREHYKSSIITFAQTIQDVLRDPEITVGIFSHTRPIAKGFLRQIKREFETNECLRALFPDILWADPAKQAPKWSEDDGLIVIRAGNPKESTIEAHGLVDGQPTGKHYALMVYDDVVTQSSVTSPEMMQKTTEALELSYNLGSEGGRRRFIGTRYHAADSYKTILDRGTARLRMRLATDDGTLDGEPVLWTRERLAEKRRDMGPYTFACFVAGTRVLMADWSERNIEDVRVGDEVIGYTFGDGKRATLVKTKVTARQNRWREVSRFNFEGAPSVTCTPDHKFWAGRAGRTYTQLGTGAKDLKAACQVYDPHEVWGRVDPYYSGYLAGLFDGEGSVSGGTVHISQSAKVNPEVCAKIETALNRCGIRWNVHTPPSRPGHRDYYVVGGREGLMAFLAAVPDAAKSPRLAECMFKHGTRNIGKGKRVKVASIEPMGADDVFNIQTETGNYIANGYAVKNCQIFQNPLADATQGFKRAWLKHFSNRDGGGMNKYMLVDAANSKRKSSDYTSIWIVGLGADRNYYALDMIRDRLNLTERADAVMRLHAKWRPMEVRYEAYGLMADIAHIQSVQEVKNYRFDIHEVKGQTPKNDRIRRLIPICEQGRFYLPHSLSYTDYEGITRDLVHEFIEQEYVAFPVAAHDDMMDALSRIAEPDLALVWPKGETEAPKRDRYAYKGGKSSAWAA